MWRSGLEDDERRRPLQKQTVEAEVEQLRRRFPAVMVLCFLAVLLLQRWQAGASPQLPCELERPAVAEGDRGASLFIHRCVGGLCEFQTSRIKAHLPVTCTIGQHSYLVEG